MREATQGDGVIYRLWELSKCYEERCVLDIPDLSVKQGEILGVVGPSGAGKSTLLRLLNFLEFPTQGKIEFKGMVFQNGHELPLALRRRVTTVFQRPMLLDRSVLENVKYGLRLRGQRDENSRVEKVLAQVGLERYNRQRARTLSGGESQRVALARAMILRPDVLLFDEPTANLDPYNVGLIEDIIRKLNQEQGVTMVLVTHNVFQAKRLADRVLFLLEGRMIELCESSKFFEAPDDPRTLAFVNGEMVY